MPIGSYPRITLNETGNTNNAPSGTGLAIYDVEIGQYKIADSNLFPIKPENEGLANQITLKEARDALYSDNFTSVANLLTSSLGPSIADLLYNNSNDTSAGDMLGEINQNLIATNYNGESAGNTLMAIFVTLSAIQSNLANGSYSIQIKGSNGNLAHVSAANRLNVTV
jgi:hypothetical protein